MTDRKNNFFIYFIISSFFLLFDFTGLLKMPLNYTGNIFVNPIKSAIYQGSILLKDSGNALMHYSQIVSIAQEAQVQKKQNTELILKIDLLTRENVKLRSQLDAPLPPTFKYVTADVISVSRYMEIVAGSNDGVAKGMVVIDGGSLVGRVNEVRNDRSTILLPNDPDIKIPAKTTRGALGQVIGQAGNVVLMDKILQKDQVFLDDVVVTSGEEGYPPNLIIGKIIHVNTDDVSPYKQAKILPIVDYTKETNVFVLTSI